MGFFPNSNHSDTLGKIGVPGRGEHDTGRITETMKRESANRMQAFIEAL